MISPCSVASSLDRPIASNSSKRTTQVSSWMYSKTFLRFEAVSPSNEETTESKRMYTRGSPNSAAIASAVAVFHIRVGRRTGACDWAAGRRFEDVPLSKLTHDLEQYLLGPSVQDQLPEVAIRELDFEEWR